ncbi:unnamed protein product [Heligmosomoides polygyrus]|uniref:HTH_Tnp_Tc3_2 domain-containing protein n=1 Tax=Heligmosomoides polygyrus TaxID=6339 RepID=A0A183GRT0_HELPZ|nr:unnamed protein product [Heligmosomoides polygyrus]
MVSNSTWSVNQVRAEADQSASTTTIWRCIRSNEHIFRQTMQKAPHLTNFHMQARLEFARKYRATQWEKVIFTVKKKFNLDGSDGYRYYWRNLRQAPITFSRRNFGGGSLMTWAGFCSRGKLKLRFPSCRMDSLGYQAVMESSLLPFLTGRKRQTHVLQQDNAAVHVSKSTTDWLQRNRLRVMEWSACSSDCNPMENM